MVSGGGTNLQSIIDRSLSKEIAATVGVVISSNPDAYALERARKARIPATALARNEFQDRQEYVSSFMNILKTHQTQLIALAGFMKKVPVEIIREWHNKILNIHPALLPAFGGKGLYGLHVHQAVLELGAKLTGVTIHLVDEQYDHGLIIYQESTPVFPNDSAETLQKRVLEIEHRAYPMVIDWFARGLVRIDEQKVFTPLDLP